MNVLVAGGTGFIGTHLCTELHDRGHDVTALSRDPDGSGLPAGVELAMGDVTAADSIRDAVAGQDAIVNLVSLSPLYKPRGKRAHDRVHLGGTETLVRAAEDHDIDRFLQMSALGADPNGRTEYIRAKGKAEDVVRESALSWTIVRPSVVFGEGGEFVAFTRQLTTPYLTALPGGGDTRFQPIWVGDLVPMLADTLEDDAHIGETYELAGPQVVTLADMTELTYETEGKSVTILPIPLSLAKIGLSAAEAVPFIPFGADQARSLEVDNTVADNDVTAFGRTVDDLRTLRSYLDIEPRAVGDQRQSA